MVGTGPYMLTEWVKGSSLTYSKNPDYWDFDEKYPDNRLPYIDQINRLIMPDKATSRAALRSGKVDYIGQPGVNQFQAAEVESFQRTNPEIVFSPWAFRSETSVAFNVRHPSPFQDIRVRKAMQMAIDLETINNTYFGGFGMTTPQGIIGDGLQGTSSHSRSGPKRPGMSLRMTRKGPKRCSMRLAIRAARMASDSRRSITPCPHGIWAIKK